MRNVKVKDIVKFIIFVIYASVIFFLPNLIEILICLLIINCSVILLAQLSFKKAILNTFKFMPFIILTFIVNVLLDNLVSALWISIKLIIVCNATFIYSQTTTVSRLAKTIKTLCTPLKLFNINPDEIEIMVCISLSLIPSIKNILLEVKNACKAKNIDINLSNMKYILSKILISMLKRVGEIDEAMIEKGCDF